MKRVFTCLLITVIMVMSAVFGVACSKNENKEPSASTEPSVSDVPSTSLKFTLNTEGTEYSVTGYNGTEKDVIIPENYKNLPVTSIGGGAFSNCSSLTSITIPDSVTSIDMGAFSDCSSLTNVTIGTGVESIGNYAFSECSSLTSITIPDSVISIGNSAFYGCSSLQYNKNENGYYLGNDDNKYLVFVKAENTSITDCNINENTRIIYNYAFSSCSKLTSITIPDSVISIGNSAFSGCNSLQYSEYDENGYYLGNDDNKYLVFVKAENTSITDCNINENTRIIYNYAFSSCSKLTSITIPDNVKSIGDYAFSDCSSLTNVTIGTGVKSIGDYAFSDCSSLTSINVSEGNENYKSIDGNLYSKDEKTLIQYAIGKPATEFTVPGSVTSIGIGAFFHCSKLTSIEISDSVTSIGIGAFYKFSSLTSITIPDSVTSIGMGAFYNCRSLTSVTIPDSVTSIGDYAFSDCSGLTSVYYKGTAEDWNKISVDVLGYLTSATRYYYSENEPTEDGNYWHYGVDGVTPVKW